MYCGECGTKLEDNIEFCPRCGWENINSDAKKERKEAEKKLRLKRIRSMVLFVCIMFFLCVGTSSIYNTISKRPKIEKSDLVGRWHTEGVEGAVFVLKENGKAKVPVIIVDEDGNRTAGNNGIYGGWKLKRKHLIIETVVDKDYGEIISIIGNVMTCNDNGEIVEYRRENLLSYDIYW